MHEQRNEANRGGGGGGTAAPLASLCTSFCNTTTINKQTRDNIDLQDFDLDVNVYVFAGNACSSATVIRAVHVIASPIL